MRSEARIDPFFQEAPWEIIYDNDGRQIGEIFVLTGESRKEATPYDPVHRVRRARRAGKAKGIHSRRIR